MNRTLLFRVFALPLLLGTIGIPLLFGFSDNAESFLRHEAGRVSNYVLLAFIVLLATYCILNPIYLRWQSRQRVKSVHGYVYAWVAQYSLEKGVNDPMFASLFEDFEEELAWHQDRYPSDNHHARVRYYLIYRARINRLRKSTHQ